MTDPSPTDAVGAADEAGRPNGDDTAYDVPSDETPARCEYCGRPFESSGLLALHRGRVHEAALTDEQRAAYEDAYAAESGQLQRFRLKALAALVLLYFGLLIVYAVV